MSGGQITKAQHDEVVRFVARTRFPFPDQTDWPDGYRTITIESEPGFPISTEGGDRDELLIDIVIVDGAGRVRETAEVEAEIAADSADRLKQASEAAPEIPESGVRHFFVYVPKGIEDEMRELLDRNGISYAGLRAFEIGENEEIAITPIHTPGHAKDHR